MKVQISRFNRWSWDVIGAGGIRLAMITEGQYDGRVRYYVSEGNAEFETFLTFDEAVAYASGR